MSCRSWAFAAFISLLATAIVARAEEPKLELDYPAPGCPTQLPTSASADAFCSARQQAATCKAAALCLWENESCFPQTGKYLAMPSLDPIAEARLGLIVRAKDLTPERTPAVAKLAEAGYVAAAYRRYDQAIAFYTQALKAEDTGIDLMVRRALVYEHKNDKPKALADYCMAIAMATDWQSEQIANQRVAQLTQPSVERLPIPRFALSGVLRVSRNVAPIAPFKIVTPAGHDYIVKLINNKTGQEDMLVFVRAGGQFETQAPLGEYRIVGAHGPVWYGEPHYFGPDTDYFKVQPQDGPETITFYRQGNTLHGAVLTFELQQDGNLLTPSIPREEFEKP